MSKPKKKYRPKPVYVPGMIIASNTFTPIENALKKLVATGEVEVDEFGTYIYRDLTGVTQSFEAGLKIYARFIEIYCMRTSMQFDISPMVKLHETMYEKLPIDESLIDQVNNCLQTCKQLVAKIPSQVSRDIISTIRLEKEIKGRIDLPTML